MSGTSGTYAFNPPLAELALDAFERCGKLGVELTQQSQMLPAVRRSMNQVLSSWANRGVNLWTVQRVAQQLVQGQIQYVDDRTCVDVLADSVILRQWPIAATYIYHSNGTIAYGSNGQPMHRWPPVAGTTPSTWPTDLRLYPLSRTDYVSIPQKNQQSRPTSYWLDRQIAPVFSLWPAPDDNIYELVYWRSRYVEDADIIGGQQLQVPQRFYEAFAAGLAAHLAMKFAPPMAMALKAYADEQWNMAANEDEEKVTLYLQPQMDVYYRA